MKTISRGKAQSAVAAAAYRAGEKILNEYDGRLNDYSRKKGVDFTTILLPENAPPEYQDRATLWNAVERKEKASNSQLAREFEISLPIELSYFQNKALVMEFVKNTFVEHGMCADIALHKMDSHNPHCHIMLTMRPFSEDGTWGDKQRKVYHLDHNGDKIYDPVKRQYKCGKEQTTDWNEKHKADEWRKAWEVYANAHLEKHGHAERIDHRSHKDRGLEQIPTIHLGTAAHQMEQRGIRTERGDINRAIKEANERIAKINVDILKLENELQQIKDEQRQEELQQKQEQQEQKIPTPTPKIVKSDSVKTPTAQVKTKPASTPKTSTPPPQKPKTLKQVNKEIDIVETKLQRLDFADQVVMSYNHRIQDDQRNLSSVGFFERRKMQKEIAKTEQQRDSYQDETTKKYGTRPQLEKQKSKLLAEKERIENATGVTAAKEREEQQKRNEAIQQRQERDRYNAKRQAKRLANPNKDKNEPSL